MGCVAFYFFFPFKVKFKLIRRTQIKVLNLRLEGVYKQNGESSFNCFRDGRS